MNSRKLLAAAVPVLEANTVIADVMRAHGFGHGTTSFAVAQCPFRPKTGLAEKMSSGWGEDPFQLGGLGGVPSSGRTGWDCFMSVRKDRDPMLLYGPYLHVGADGEACSFDSNPMLQAFCVVDEAAGIEGLDHKLLQDRFDLQQSLLLLGTAKAYDDIVSHPDPHLKLAFTTFTLIQDYIREAIDWAEIASADKKLGSIGGITIGHPDGDLFLPLAVEIFNPNEGAVHELTEELFPDAWRLNGKLLFPLEQEE
mmetsp:Transcript_20062/g.27217  ORF Transcript_20062/g.27217 Transcript_20062/m.27217 type:complete len:253 (-) Transcript_20062:393-1151(-)|eukprot:CAMPEP_0185770338 /NCGR_PEP_ID=MMETSP1174-20130828/58643_1 /TAXON_ID=35687 /ORGANISM="Dictyocha speculum, Strain CCMP1381" /LENGTH=252 /DNA_ID=CAMNT_0028455731 /DNA_START=48 /DNA_END=806 /DNA_ORIENTATION=-